MVIQTNNGTLTIKFSRVASNGVRGFKCTLPFMPGSKETSGVSFCSPKDKWNPAKGKKVALARALESAAIPKYERAEIWDSYLAQAKAE